MKEIVADPGLVAYCGLYCGSCKKYRSGSCPGCHDNIKATWCKVRSCNMEHGYQSCADCKEFSDPKECKMFNNIFAKFFAIVFKSDRPACISRIKEEGIESFAAYMAANKLQSIRRS